MNLLFVELEVELPGLGLAFGELSLVVGEGYTNLDDFEVVTVALYHLVLEVLHESQGGHGLTWGTSWLAWTGL